MSSTPEVFAAMKEAVTGNDGIALQGKFKVGSVVAEFGTLSFLSVLFNRLFASRQGTVTFTVGEEVYSLDLSSSSSRNVTKGDIFNGNADLIVTCSPEVMGKMIRKEVQPQQGERI